MPTLTLAASAFSVISAFIMALSASNDSWSPGVFARVVQFRVSA
jgi:hypothetical protein